MGEQKMRQTLTSLSLVDIRVGACWCLFPSCDFVFFPVFLDSGPAIGRTLFVINIPVYYSSAHISELFSNAFGAVESVIFLQNLLSLQYNLYQKDKHETLPCSDESFYRSAYVVFEDEDSVKLAITSNMLTNPQPEPLLSTVTFTPLSSNSSSSASSTTSSSSSSSSVLLPSVDPSLRITLPSWLTAYHLHHPDVTSLSQNIDRFMAAFDLRTDAEKQAEKQKGKTIVDDEGFTLVLPKSKAKKRKMMILQMEAEQRKLLNVDQDDSKKKKKKNQPNVNFYRNQEKEQKKERK